MTRQNFIPSEDNENQMIDALIPLWDMLNHEEGKVRTGEKNNFFLINKIF